MSLLSAHCCFDVVLEREDLAVLNGTEDGCFHQGEPDAKSRYGNSLADMNDGFDTLRRVVLR